MNIPKEIKAIEVYYDGKCAMCCTFQEWVMRQKRSFAVEFVPYQSDRAEEIFPGVAELDPDRDMIVRTNDGEIFRGAEGWVLCMLSCQSYQKWAKRLASPGLLPVAKKTCNLIAAKRLGISKILFRKKDKALADAVRDVSQDDCGGSCQLDHPEDAPDGLL